MTPRTELTILLIVLVLQGSRATTRYFLKMRTNGSEVYKSRGDGAKVLEDVGMETRNPFSEHPRFPSVENGEDEESSMDEVNAQTERRNSFTETSTFDPEVLNKFLEDYANKIKGSTDRNLDYPFAKGKPSQGNSRPELEIDPEGDLFPSTLPTTTTKRSEQTEKSAIETIGDTTGSTVDEDEPSQVPGDSLKRNKYWGMNSPSDERNGNGWVTLDAIPWSKSKISKWQANPSTQRPWPEIKPWSKPSVAKPWQNDYPSRPSVYNHNEPSWYDRPKPHWTETNALEKPWTKPSRPSYHVDDNSNVNQQSEKWPPERPSWDHHSDIITDDRPTNFPGSQSWNRPANQIPSYSNDYGTRRPEDDNGDWQDFPSRYDTNRRRPSNRDRPSHFAHYQYANGHPPTHPANGDGQWVLLSTNRGYSKSRQRSIKLDGPNTQVALVKPINAVKAKGNVKKEDPESTVAVMTSKRQVRLTVLPSINGTNTTTSHGGLLEVERTFKSVDQSRKEFEREQKLSATQPTFLAAKPISGIAINGRPSSSAVLAAVGAGMLPATMAMMIPMMLGRRKRNIHDDPLTANRSIDNRRVPTRNVKAR